jgi:hypothetical protein
VKFSFGSVNVCQNLLGKLLLIINGPVKGILTLHEAGMELRVVLSMTSLRSAIYSFSI